MSYQLVIHYHTGDSFSSHDKRNALEITWEDIKVAEENINRIEEHYAFYGKMYNQYHAPFNEMKKKYGKERWFVMSDKSYNVKLVTDDGKEFRQDCFWRGYFEALYSVSIKRSKR